MSHDTGVNLTLNLCWVICQIFIRINRESQNRVAYSKKLERVMHFATRWAMNSPYRSDGPNYLSYPERIEALGLLTIQERRNISIMITPFKIWKQELKTEAYLHTTQSLTASTKGQLEPVRH